MTIKWIELPVNCRECGETMGYMESFRKISPKKSRIICVDCHNENLIVIEESREVLK